MVGRATVGAMGGDEGECECKCVCRSYAHMSEQALEEDADADDVGEDDDNGDTMVAPNATRCADSLAEDCIEGRGIRAMIK